jgi:hypothetical protein
MRLLFRGLGHAFVGVLLMAPAGCGSPDQVEGKVTITSTKPFGNPKAIKSKPPQKPGA